MTLLQFHLSFNNGAERLQLPVNPESIHVVTSRGYQDIEVSQLGEYTIIGNERLREFSFASFFPRGYNPSYCEYVGFRPPWEIVRMIERWMASGRPIRFVLSGQIYGEEITEIINSPVTVRTFEYSETAGSVGDVAYELELKEFRFIEFTRVRKITTAISNESVDGVTLEEEMLRPDQSEKLAAYTVVSGDSLWKIAAKTEIYGNGDLWRTIYNANKETIGKNPNLIQPDQILVIPR